ncbi:MAG: hypothetical protein AB7I42_16110 [Bradyrhizobium sp.]|uniref:hypothetical protein n=1 Tax=Bradyrhizobium sp. TaxID=376 RepID=UPI00353F9006
MQTRWPWISLLLAIIVTISPLGRDVIYSAFFSSEQLSRNIAKPMFFIGLAIMALIVALEWLIRHIIFRRRARGAMT